GPLWQTVAQTSCPLSTKSIFRANWKRLALYWSASRHLVPRVLHVRGTPHMPRNRPPNVQSALHAPPVDAHERMRDYLSEVEFRVLLQGTRDSRYRWRNTAMLLLTF